MASKERGATACSYCPSQGHTWATPDGKRLCFGCLRKQRDEYWEACQQAKSEAKDLACDGALVREALDRIEEARSALLALTGGEP